MKKYNKGFTLIELLVVIAIIGILSSIVVVNLSSAKSKASRASALTTISGLGTELILCQDDSATIVGPETTQGNSGAEWVCKTAPAGDPAASGHTVQWPTLANTSGYCYSYNGTGCITPATNGVAEGTAPFTAGTIYLFNTNNALITCTWSATANMTCI